jgi:hypothetical protein
VKKRLEKNNARRKERIVKTSRRNLKDKKSENECYWKNIEIQKLDFIDRKTNLKGPQLSDNCSIVFIIVQQ